MKLLAPSIAATLLLAACSGKPAAETTAASAAMPAQSPAAQPAGQAIAAHEAAGVPIITGPVLETFDAGSYTYVRVKTDGGDVWAASAQFAIAVGDRVVVPLETPMENFRSPSLNREFPIIYFASRITREGGAPTPVKPALAASHGPSRSGPVGAMGAMGGQASGAAAPVVAKTAPPEGGLSVADVWARRASLAGQAVTVRGTVVKFNGGIMGTNWFHIQDGSGAAADGTHDLTVTSAAVVKVGDLVTVKGTIAVDKDFTAGYVYGVILEGATLVSK